MSNEMFRRPENLIKPHYSRLIVNWMRFAARYWNERDVIRLKVTQMRMGVVAATTVTRTKLSA